MRYFFISYYRRASGDFVEMVVESEKFPSRKEIRRASYTVEGQHPLSPICIINIQELSKQDYIDFLQ